MSRRRTFTLAVTHLAALAGGLAAGIYALPILIAPPAPDGTSVAQVAKTSEYVGTFSRDRKDSDAFHW